MIDPSFEIPTVEFAHEFLARLRQEYPGLSLADIKKIYEDNEDVAGLLSIELAEYAIRHQYSKPSEEPEDHAPVRHRSEVTEPISKKWKPKGINRAYYNNVLTLYALIAIQDMQSQKQEYTEQTPILDDIQATAEVISDYASWRESEKATQAATKRAQKQGKTPPAPKRKCITAAQILKQIHENSYLRYGSGLIDHHLKHTDRSELDHFEETSNENLAHNLATIRHIVQTSVLKKLAPYINRKHR